MWAVHKKTCASRAPKAKPKPDFEGETIDLAGFDPTMLAAMTAATSAAQGALDGGAKWDAAMAAAQGSAQSALDSLPGDHEIKGGNVKIAASTTTHGLQIPWAPPRMNMSKGAMLACNASASAIQSPAGSGRSTLDPSAPPQALTLARRMHSLASVEFKDVKPAIKAIEQIVKSDPSALNVQTAHSRMANMTNELTPLHIACMYVFPSTITRTRTAP
jgi:hypothetical protein